MTKEGLKGLGHEIDFKKLDKKDSSGPKGERRQIVKFSRGSSDFTLKKYNSLRLILKERRYLTFIQLFLQT
jgi:hypothetical protein